MSNVSKAQTQLVELKTVDIIAADWNYKVDGTDQEIERLIKSIERDKSVGVLAVREIDVDGKQMFEVIDGNHRLAAVSRMGWEKIPCENFGEITLAQAVTIARRRNHQWFDEDAFKMAELYKDVILPEIDKQDLLEFMPDSEQDIDNYMKLMDWTWESIAPQDGDEGEDGDGGAAGSVEYTKLELNVSTGSYQLWEQWVNRISSVLGERDVARAFEFAMIELSNIPDDSIDAISGVDSKTEE